MKIVRYAGIIEEAVSPKNIYCFLLLSELTESEKVEFRGLLQSVKPESSRLIGAEICFNQSILRTVEYDIYTSFQKYAASEQRKGK